MEQLPDAVNQKGSVRATGNFETGDGLWQSRAASSYSNRISIAQVGQRESYDLTPELPCGLFESRSTCLFPGNFKSCYHLFALSPTKRGVRSTSWSKHVST